MNILCLLLLLTKRPKADINARMDYLKLTTPLNIDTEKKQFFASDTYEPQFTYAWESSSLEQLDTFRPELIQLRDALLSQDVQAVTNAGARFFAVRFRAEDMQRAQELVRYTPQESAEGVQELVTELTTHLRELDIDYRVEIVDRHGFKCRPDHQAKVVRVSAHLHLQFPSARSVARHELVHIIRAINGTYNAIPKQSGYLPTEEGLACLVQDKLLREPSGSSFQHAVEYLAANLSQQAGLRAIYTFLRNHGCSAENAWSRAIRAKFGLIDTAQPGGLLRGAMYFYHAQLLKGFTEDELLRLFVAKIPQTQLDQYPVYTGLVAPEQIRHLWQS